VSESRFGFELSLEETKRLSPNEEPTGRAQIRLSRGMAMILVPHKDSIATISVRREDKE